VDLLFSGFSIACGNILFIQKEERLKLSITRQLNFIDRAGSFGYISPLLLKKLRKFL
jgi:hypothetical protein